MDHTKRQSDMIVPNFAIWATLGNFGRKIVAQKVATFLATFHILHFPLIYQFQCMVW
jgi:hypothetical protein